MKKIEDYLDKKGTIYCKTEDEFNKIIKLINSIKKYENATSNRSYNSQYSNYINLFITTNWIVVGSKKVYEDYTTYPASDFLIEEIPEYVELLSNFDTKNTGKIFNTSEKPLWNYNKNGYNSEWEFLIKGPHAKYFKPSTKAAFDLQQKQLLLLEEARKKYSFGTTVNNKNILSCAGGTFIIDCNEFIAFDDEIQFSTNNGKTLWTVYSKGNWAEIIEQPKEIKQDKFVFPEFWYIEVNEKSLDAINKHRLTDFKIPIKLNEWAYYGISSSYCDILQAYNTIPKDAVKITLEEFKKYVLKETLAERLIPLQQAVESVRCNIEHNFQLAGFNGGIFQLEHEVKSIIKPINKIELNLKKTTIKPVVKQRKQLTIIKTKKLKLN